MTAKGARRLPVFVFALLAAMSCAGGQPQPAAQSPATQACHKLQVKVTEGQLAGSSDPTPGFSLGTLSRPVGIALDRDGASVWVLETGSDTVVHIDPAGKTVGYALPVSELGLQLSVATDGTVWIPERYRHAVAAISPDGSVRECSLLAADGEPVATSVAADSDIWVSEATTNRIARLSAGKFTEYPLGGPTRNLNEVLAASDGGAWFTEGDAPQLGHLASSGSVEEVALGGSGGSIGMAAGPDGSIWVAGFGGDRVVRVGADRSVTSIATRTGAKPQSLAFAADGTLWLTESGADHLARIRGTTVEEVVATGRWPDHLVVTPDGWAWFTEYNGGRVGRVKLPAT